MTELDLTILAIIARDGPMSAYDVRKVFARSLTSTWSSSTGSIYPSIRRLQKARHVAATTAKGARARKALRVTASGRGAVDAWLLHITAGVAGPTPNPIRTRMYFVGIVAPAKRSAIIRRATESTRAAIAAAEQARADRMAADEGDAVQHLASEGVLFELRARLEWLTWLEAQVRNLPSK
ncbi:MAG: PadR family transcriptional regulator [Chthoniobacterales bacterium]|nr:PadR family transcriptional regulator [Chthoniobacterales bacterium]